METTLIDRVRNILLRPTEEWQVIAGESPTVGDLYRSYIAPLAAIGPVASIVGLSFVGVGIPMVGRHRVPIGAAVFQALVTYVLSLVAVYVVALVIDALAPSFSGERSRIQALKLAAYSSTAAWLAGIFGLVPALGFFALVGLYSLYLLYVGAPVLMKVPRQKIVGYTISVVIAAFLVFLVAGLVSGTLLPRPAAMPPAR
jgi:hypothetical protein